MSGLKLGAGVAAAMLTGLVLGFSVSTSPALAQSEEGLEEGRKLVETNCGACHGVGKADASPHVDAPLFRKLSERFPPARRLPPPPLLPVHIIDALCRRRQVTSPEPSSSSPPLISCPQGV